MCLPFCALAVGGVAVAAFVSALLAELARLREANSLLLEAVGALDGDVRRNLEHTLRLLQPSSCELNGTGELASFKIVAQGAQPLVCDSTYTVVAVLAGRRDRMRLLLPYLNALRSSGSLDEVHLWDYSRTMEDKAWLQQIASRHSYTLFHVDSPDNRHLALYDFYSPSSHGPRFQPQCSEPVHDSVVIVKLDDDIVFLNVTAFPRFVSFARQAASMTLVHANVVNNGVAAFYQCQHVPGLQAQLPELCAYPERHWRPGLGGALVYGSQLAAELHRKFAREPLSFAWEDPLTNSCLAYAPPEGVGSRGFGQGQFSVNAFAARWAAWRELRGLARCVDVDYDEPSVTALASRLGHRECIFTPFTAAHLTFGPQDDAVVLPQAIPLYEELLARAGLDI